MIRDQPALFSLVPPHTQTTPMVTMGPKARATSYKGQSHELKGPGARAALRLAQQAITDLRNRRILQKIIYFHRRMLSKEDYFLQLDSPSCHQRIRIHNYQKLMDLCK